MAEPQVVVVEKFLDDTDGLEFCSPVEDLEGQLHLVGQSGDILKVVDDETQVWFSIGGQPSSLAFDGNGGSFLGDKAHQAILAPSETDSGVEATPVVKDYEGRPLLGPHAMAVSDATLFFTDCGPLGEATLSSPSGSVFAADLDQMVLRPLAYRCLAYPSGVTVSNDGKTVFVAETLQNRILRFAQSQGGQYHASVFCRFTSRLGPMSLAMSPNNLLYVARFDFRDSAKDGKISIINQEGQQEAEDIIIPDGPEISGLSFSKRQPNVLWVTELATASCYRVTLPADRL